LGFDIDSNLARDRDALRPIVYSYDIFSNLGGFAKMPLTNPEIAEMPLEPAILQICPWNIDLPD
jgi:hypothetical protein